MQVAVVQPQQGPLIEQGVRRQCQPRCLPQPPVVQRAGGELAAPAAQQPAAGLVGDVVTVLCAEAPQRGQRAAVVKLPAAQRRLALGGQLPGVGQAGRVNRQTVQPGYLPPAGQRRSAHGQLARLPQPAVVGGVDGQHCRAAAQQPAVGPAGIARHPVQRQRRRALYSAGVVHRARPHRQRLALQVAGVAQRLRAHRGGPVAQQRPGRQIGQVSPAGDVQLRQPHQSPAVGQRAGGDLQPLAADVALLRHPVRRQRHRAVAPHLTAHAAGVALRQVQRHRVRRPQRAGVVQRPGVKPQVLPLPVSLMGHRPGLHPPVAVAEQLPARAHRQPVAQAQRAALLRQQRAAVIQTVAGQAQRAALHAAAVADVVRRQHQRAAGRQRARIVQRTTG